MFSTPETSVHVRDKNREISPLMSHPEPFKSSIITKKDRGPSNDPWGIGLVWFIVV